MNRAVNQIGRVAVIASLIIGTVAARGEAGQTSEVVASGKLEGWLLASSLFHIDEFWMKVASGTDFNRWLSEGLDHTVVVSLAPDAVRLGDEKNVRILSGTLVHEIAPQPTPMTTDVVGRLPEGDSGFVHVFFLTDVIAGSMTLSAVTFETADLATVSKFCVYEGARVNIIISIR